jgi:methionyl-tRNA formyltransferase
MNEPATKSSGRNPLCRAIFFGSPAFAVPSLRRLVQTAGVDLRAVVSQPDRPAGRGQAVTEPAVKAAARALVPGIPILQPEKIRTGEFETALRDLAADLFVVVAYGRILPQSILDLPRFGPWNVHASLLPRWRGAAPIQWSVINGDQETGVSIMRMEAGLDTGPVAAVAKTPIGEDETAGALGTRLAELGAELLAATLPGIVGGSVVLTPQDDAGATVAPLLRKEDGQLDFQLPAPAVAARARGVDPWPGASALLQGVPVKLFGVRVASGADAAPGTVLAIDGGGLRVACGGGGAVTFAEVQLAGRKRLPAAVVATGRSIAVGARFGA